MADRPYLPWPVFRRSDVAGFDRSLTGAIDWNLIRFPSKAVRRRSGSLRIFISYRRNDASGYAQLLHSHIAARFSPENVFIDLRNIDPGRPYQNVLHSTLQACDVALIVIGPGWLTATNVSGKRRLDEPNDWVRTEVAATLIRDIRVVPVLVGGATMPDAADLPVDLAPLTERQGIAIPDMGLAQVLTALLDSLDGEDQ